MNKNFKLEFVVFNISHENAVFLWKMLTRVIEFCGFDVTGDVTDNNDLGYNDYTIGPSDAEYYYSDPLEHDSDDLEPDGFPK